MIVELICPYCQFSKKIPRDKIPPGARAAKCPSCRQRFAIPMSNPNHETALDAELVSGYVSDSGGTPWENRSQLGLWRSIYQTFKEALFSPETFFRAQKSEGGLREPFAFGLLVGSIGAMFGFFWQFLLFSGGIHFLSPTTFGPFSMVFTFLFMLILVPALVTAGIFIYGIILHFLLILVRGGRNGFEATFKVVCYSQAAHLWGLVPFFGWIGTIWQLIVQIIGLRELHETSYFRVILAFLIPVGFIFLTVIGAAVLIFTFFTQQFYQL